MRGGGTTPAGETAAGTAQGAKPRERGEGAAQPGVQPHIVPDNRAQLVIVASTPDALGTGRVPSAMPGPVQLCVFHRRYLPAGGTAGAGYADSLRLEADRDRGQRPTWGNMPPGDDAGVAWPAHGA
jgi:hypothetical protein